MNARRMTESDYRELDLPVPDGLVERVVVVIQEVERCEQCGDEDGECGCND